MRREIKTEKLPIKMWLDDAEAGAIEQARNLANFPYAVEHISLMPDCHQGFGMPIGGVMATQDVIVPNAVGVDIGCGMCAVQTSLTEISKPDMFQILSGIRSRVPVGFKHHKQSQDESLMPDRKTGVGIPVVDREYESATRQIGTLGGGNHFIEIQKGSDGHIWVMVHSGSRNIGYKVADHYNRLAVRLNEKWNSPVPKAHQLAYLPLDSKEAQQYINEMNYCIDFALASRKLMMENTVKVIKSHLGGVIQTAPMINIAHNYASFENHFDQDVVVHRKGATKADMDTVGIIPGSQGANSFIVKGKGNKDSFESCSHGAGRTMGRKQAIRTLDLEKEKKKLDELGIIHSIRSRNDLEEASSAYKDIIKVMQFQDDLVEILCELSPLAVVKG